MTNRGSLPAAGDVDLVVRGGTAVTSRARRRADVLVGGGKVLAVHPGHWPGRASTEVDGRGLLVLPGMIDTHVHLMDPGDLERETFPAGTAAAAAAGVTTIVEHTHAWPVTTVERLHEKVDHLAGRAHVDYGLAAHAWPDQLAEVRALWEAGVAFFKVFTCDTHGVPGFDAADLLDLGGRLAAVGGRALAHCEDQALTARAEAVLRAAGREDPGLLVEWRSREAELVAVAMVAMVARLTSAPVRIAHASSPEVLALVREERRRGAPLSAETCPQYLLLREGELHEHGTLRKFTPPARARDDREEQAMWDALNDGSVDHIASDHAPSTRAQKAAGDVWSAPFGLPGIDSTFPLVLDQALSGRTTVEQVVRLYAEAPARHLGLAAKGSLDPGADADLVLVDPAARWTLDAGRLRSRAGWSPYEGRALQGRVVATYLRGRCVYDGEAVLEERHGRFLPGAGAAGARP